MRILSILLSLFLFVSIADAKPQRHNVANPTVISQYDNDGRMVFSPFQFARIGSAPERSRHSVSKQGAPGGCPSAWCGCWLSMHVFGQNKRELWKATSWLKFRRTAPSVGAVAVMRGHVGIVVGFNGKGDPILKSGNYAGGVGTGVHSKHTVLAYVNPR